MALVRDHDHLRSLAGAATGRDLGELIDGDLAAWGVTPSGHPVENMTTHALDHVGGTLADGTPWRVFAKTLHPASASPTFAFVPPEHRAQVLRDLDWQDEPRIYRSALAADLPDGVRLPAVWAIDECGSERLVLWLEHVEDEGGAWDLARYRRSARALGRLTGRWPEDRAAGELGLTRRSLASLFFGKICTFDLPMLAEDRTWSDPAVVVAATADPALRDDLRWLADAVPGLLDRLDALPHGLAHGDASPGNLHETADGTVVALDWSYGSIGAVGSDLGQLLAGRFESGLAEAAEVDRIAETLFDGYAEGLADEGHPVDRAQLELAWAVHLAVRSAFSALLVDRPDLDDATRADLVGRRAALARFAVDLARLG